VVIKILARRSPIYFPREVESLRVLSHVPGARTPRLLAWGDATGGNLDHPYLVMERIPGAPLGDFREGLAQVDKIRIASQIAEMLKAMHSVPVESLRHFGANASEWVQRMRERVKFAVEHLTPDWPPHLAEQLPAFLEENLRFVTEDFQPRLLGADIHSHHILLECRDGELQVSGQIDLGDVEVGPVEYEWVFLCQEAFNRDPRLVHSFLQAYGYPIPFSDMAKGQLKLYTLLHRFPPFFPPRPRSGDTRSLDELLEAMWTF
jgi:aminoglycoside phosphotransferase (APT) family kinase protein